MGPAERADLSNPTPQSFETIQPAQNKKASGVFKKQKEARYDRQVVWGVGTMGQSGMKKLWVVFRSMQILNPGPEWKVRDHPQGGLSQSETWSVVQVGRTALKDFGVRTLNKSMGTNCQLDDEGLGTLEKHWSERIQRVRNNSLEKWKKRKFENLSVFKCECLRGRWCHIKKNKERKAGLGKWIEDDKFSPIVGTGKVLRNLSELERLRKPIESLFSIRSLPWNNVCPWKYL